MNLLAHLGGIVTPLQKTWLWMPKGSPWSRKFCHDSWYFPVRTRSKTTASFQCHLGADLCRELVHDMPLGHPYQSIQHVQELYICFSTLSESGLAIMTTTVF